MNMRQPTHAAAPAMLQRCSFAAFGSESVTERAAGNCCRKGENTEDTGQDGVILMAGQRGNQYLFLPKMSDEMMK